MGAQLSPYVEGGEKEPIPFEIQAGVSKRFKHVPFRLSIDAIQLQNWNLAYNDSLVATNNSTTLSDEEKDTKRVEFKSKMNEFLVLTLDEKIVHLEEFANSLK